MLTIRGIRSTESSINLFVLTQDTFHSRELQSFLHEIHVVFPNVPDEPEVINMEIHLMRTATIILILSLICGFTSWAEDVKTGWHVIFEDDFTDNKNRWPENNNSNSTFAVAIICCNSEV